MNLIGDGINVAQRIMSFAEEGQLLVSRSYYDIVSCLSQEYARLFHYKGARADKHIREHDIYSVETTGLRSNPASHHPENIIKQDTPQGEPSAAIETVPPSEVATGPVSDTGTKRYPMKTILLVAVPLVVVLTIAGIFLLPKPQDKAPAPAAVFKSSTSEVKDVTEAKEAAKAARAVQRTEEREKAKKARIAEKKVEEKNAGSEEIIRNSSVRADEIEFTATGIKRSAENVTISIRIHNNAAVAKSVALYDDYVRWPKSKLIDQDGKSHEVNKVVFVKGSRTITSQASGTQGLMLNSGQSAMVSLTFKKTGKGVKKFALHPFIYVGRSWKEHDLPMKVRL